VIRRATVDDAAALVALWDGAYAHERSPDGLDAVTRALQDDHLVCVVAVDDDRIIGSLLVAFDGWRGNLYRLAVAPAHRRHGVARELLAHGERALRELGAARRVAIVDARNDAARAFWSAHGYEPDPDAVRYVGP
jgi:ribosomal protein S18 acetylase RimI-like enzyme